LILPPPPFSYFFPSVAELPDAFDIFFSWKDGKTELALVFSLTLPFPFSADGKRVRVDYLFPSPFFFSSDNSPIPFSDGPAILSLTFPSRTSSPPSSAVAFLPSNGEFSLFSFPYEEDRAPPSPSSSLPRRSSHPLRQKRRATPAFFPLSPPKKEEPTPSSLSS